MKPLSEQWLCWKCGAPLTVPMPLAREAQCLACSADLHVCRLCRFFNPKTFERCDEPRAEKARLSDRSNFCGYFTQIPNPSLRPESHKADQAKARLESLFGIPQNATGALGENAARDRLESLFNRPKK